MMAQDGTIYTSEEALPVEPGTEYSSFNQQGQETERCKIINLATDRITGQTKIVYEILQGSEMLSCSKLFGRSGDWIVCSKSQFFCRFRPTVISVKENSTNVG